MNERAVLLGEARHLMAVVSTPVEPRNVPGVLLLNAGVMSRVGPGRINVKLARHLARAGHTVLRLDLSGLGDSRTAVHAAPFREQAVRDIRCAIDYLCSNHGVARVALCGICSGAENAYLTALEDARVAGVFLFDGYAYSTRLARLRRLLSRLRRVTVGKLRRRLTSTADTDPVQQSGPLIPPPRPQFAAGLQSLVDRAVAVTLCYTPGPQYWYAGQFRECFGREPFCRDVECRFEPSMDHLVTTLGAQQRFIALVDQWLQRTGAAGSARRESDDDV